LPKVTRVQDFPTVEEVNAYQRRRRLTPVLALLAEEIRDAPAITDERLPASAYSTKTGASPLRSTRTL
jgi:hypothetical protein